MGMGAGLGDGGGGRRGGTVLSEINVTPFVDVMLVLLVIFMVTAPLMTQGIEMNLPKVKADNLTQQEKPLILEIDASRVISINQNQFRLEDLAPKLPAIFEHRKDRQLFIRADGSVSWEYLAQVMAAARAAGVEKVGMVTEPGRGPAPAPAEDRKKGG